MPLQVEPISAVFPSGGWTVTLKLHGKILLWFRGFRAWKGRWLPAGGEASYARGMTPHPRCEIIAEAGVNHDGREDLALRLVEAAAETGADTVKFQTFDPAELSTAAAPTAAYQAEAGQGAVQSEMLSRLVLPRDALSRVVDHARVCGVRFLSTPSRRSDLAFRPLMGEPPL